jgi:hypothetical protein
MIDIPVLDNEEMWASKAIDSQGRNSNLNPPQLMWIDVITAVLNQPTFDIKIGNMSYVFRNMIAKYVSSADYYRISEGVLNSIVKGYDELEEKISLGMPVDMKKYFYGKSKLTLLEHMIPTAVVSKELVTLPRPIAKSAVEKVLINSGEVAIILRDEDKLLLKSKMPEGWKYGDSYFARYQHAKVVISSHVFVKRGNVIYR